jgi:hypothetical protein
MTFGVSNFKALRNAVEVYDESDQDEPLIIIFHTPGNVYHRFIVAEHGVMKQDCTASGEPM